MWPIPQETADLVTFTEEILNEKFWMLAEHGHQNTQALHEFKNIYLLFNNFMSWFTVSNALGRSIEMPHTS